MLSPGPGVIRRPHTSVLPTPTLAYPAPQIHQNTKPPPKTGRYGYLVWLAVSTKTQGLGVGKRLLHAFEAAMKEEGARICLIDTQSDNVAARSFFSKAGFRNFEDHRCVFFCGGYVCVV